MTTRDAKADTRSTEKSSVFCVSSLSFRESSVFCVSSLSFREFAKPIAKQDTGGIKPRTLAML